MSKPAAQVVPDGDPQFVAGLCQTQERVAAIAPDVAAGSGADLSACDVAANVVFRTVGVERNFRPFQHHQQFSLVGMQPRQQAVQRHKAGPAEENAVKA